MEDIVKAMIDLFYHGDKIMEKTPPNNSSFITLRTLQPIELVFGPLVNG